MNDNKILFGRIKICNHFEMGAHTFYSLIDLGMPCKKVNSMWFCHAGAVEEWIRKFTCTC